MKMVQDGVVSVQEVSTSSVVMRLELYQFLGRVSLDVLDSAVRVLNEIHWFWLANSRQLAMAELEYKRTYIMLCLWWLYSRNHNIPVNGVPCSDHF